jgi:tartrate dehydratase beta subunit/fumarate hydratase class I family protein
MSDAPLWDDLGMEVAGRRNIEERKHCLVLINNSGRQLTAQNKQTLSRCPHL